MPPRRAKFSAVTALLLATAPLLLGARAVARATVFVASSDVTLRNTAAQREGNRPRNPQQAIDSLDSDGIADGAALCHGFRAADWCVLVDDHAEGAGQGARACRNHGGVRAAHQVTTRSAILSPETGEGVVLATRSRPVRVTRTRLNSSECRDS